MKTDELIEKLNDIIFDVCPQCALTEDENNVIEEIIKRLEELEELREIIRNPHITQHETMKRLLSRV